jgi:hypothetical protein
MWSQQFFVSIKSAAANLQFEKIVQMDLYAVRIRNMVIETDETLFLAPFNSLNIYIFLVIL